MNLFVYGTLQPGHAQFNAFFGSQQPALPAWVHGHLASVDGYPLLQLAQSWVIHEASYRWEQDFELYSNAKLAQSEPTGKRISGFLLPSALTEQNLAGLDSYEDIQPPLFGPYRRLLTWCWLPQPVAVWLYAQPV